MKLKTLLAGLLIGSLAMVGCSSDNDDDPVGAKGTGTASKALMDGSDVTFADGTIAGLTGIKTAQGKFSYDKKAFDDATKPVKIVVSGGKIMGTDTTPATLTSYAAEANANVNLGTTLAAKLYEKLPEAEKTAANAKATLSTALDIVKIAAAPLLTGADEADVEVLMGATTPYSESVFLAALTALGATANGATVTTDGLKGLEANLDAILTSTKIIPAEVTMENLGTVSTNVTTEVATASTNITTSASALKEVYKENSQQIANAGLSTPEEVKKAEEAVDTGKLPEPPANTPDPNLSNGWVFDDAQKGSRPVDTWYVNNSSSTNTVTMLYRGGLSSFIPTNASNSSLYPSTGGLNRITYEPVLTGLNNKELIQAQIVDDSTLKFTFDIGNMSTDMAKNKSVVTVKATFAGQAGKFITTELPIPFKVVANASSTKDSSVVLK